MSRRHRNDDSYGAARDYVVLTSGGKQLAVFRVRPGPDGQLKRLRRPPRDLRSEDES